jgi:two-component system OmpR family response regulator
MAKPPEGRVARLTETGRKAFWEAQVQKSVLPKEYLRVMGLVEFQGHPNVVRSYLRRYPDRLIDEWLAELEEAGLLEYTPYPYRENADLQFRSGGAATAPTPVLDEDKRLISDESWAAGNILSMAGAYVSKDRVENRPVLNKPRSETVILVVEDDPDQLALAQRRVGLAGYQIRQAESGLALREDLQKLGAPDLLLLDVTLPDCNGFDILSELRSHPALSLLPIVMLTVKSDPADIQMGIALGADGYITKPYSKAILAQTIEQVLRLAA